MSFIYEVTVTLPASEKARALLYMRQKHIAEVLQDKAFLGAEFFAESEKPGAETFSFTTQYRVQSEELLEKYFSGYGKLMREDFNREFAAAGPQVVRRILELAEKF